MDVDTGTLPETTDEPIIDVAPPEVETTDEPLEMEETIRQNYRRLNGITEPTAEQRARDEAGRFAKASETSAAPASTDAAPAATAVPATAPAAHDAYPSSWKKGMDQEWAKLPPAMREEIHRREQNFLDGIKEYREPAAFGRAIGQEMLPHVDIMRQVGVTPQQLTKEIMGYWSELVRGTPDRKGQVLLHLAQQYGIDISTLAAPRHRDDSQQQSAASMPDLSPVLQRVASVEQQLVAQRQEVERQLSEQANQEVQRFASNPERKHFLAVQGQMAQLVAAGQANTLDEAYDKAIWMVPEVRALVLSEQDAKRQADEAARAAAARKASATNVNRRGTPPVAQKAGSMDDTIRAKWRELQSQ